MLYIINNNLDQEIFCILSPGVELEKIPRYSVKMKRAPCLYMLGVQGRLKVVTGLSLFDSVQIISKIRLQPLRGLYIHLICVHKGCSVSVSKTREKMKEKR